MSILRHSEAYNVERHGRSHARTTPQDVHGAVRLRSLEACRYMYKLWCMICCTYVCVRHTM
ncbi:hypothetical protein WOLCODRAFT_141130 [Wolfiporia cocos MD-104 SS10]|uniref:Uncharacterized protein n=1 Tax=Wolfiporia cocos (strain MD-104) TaxID=742152 RepID=A0A2H3JA88_WOLCO|nr:hypothetical protein WOLCODRAFT_141130 [Wolfiporia cocos MD-104 SS10]